jgi:hypothetical protein
MKRRLTSLSDSTTLGAGVEHLSKNEMQRARSFDQNSSTDMAEPAKFTLPEKELLKKPRLLQKILLSDRAACMYKLVSQTHYFRLKQWAMAI